jgi:hypothetical protein
VALTGTDRGTGTHNTSATSFTLSPASNFTAGAMAVLCVANDNSGSAGAVQVINVTDSLGNTWTRRASPIIDPGAANAGQEGGIYTTPQNGGTLQTGTVITVTFANNTVAKTWTLMEVTAGAGKVVRYVTSGIGTGGTGTTSPTITTGSITNGRMVIAALFLEAGTTETITQDADTTNGTWSAQQTAEIGSTTSGSNIASQRKVVTATATQTYNPTLGIAGDLCLAWIELREATIIDAYTDPFSGSHSSSLGPNWQMFDAAADYGVGGGVATINIPAAGNERQAAVIDFERQNVDVLEKFRSGEVPAGGSETPRLMARVIDNLNYYRVQVVWNLDLTVDLQLDRVIAGAQTTLTTGTNVGSMAANTDYWCRIQTEGISPTTFRSRFWADGASEPSTWTETTDSTAPLQAVGSVGFGARLHSSFSTAPVLFTWDDFTAGAIAILLIGSAPGTSTADGLLTTSIKLVGDTAGVATAAGGLTTQIALAGSSAGAATAAGELTSLADTALAGTSAGIATAAAALTTQIKLVGTSAGTSAAVGAFADTLIFGSSAGTSNATGNLTTAIALASVSAGLSTAAGVLTTAIRFAGASAGVATAAGNLTTVISLVGAAPGTANAAAALTTAIALTGATVGVSSATANLSTAIALAGTAAGTSDAHAAFEGTAVLFFGTTDGSSSATGVLTTGIALAGASAGSSTAAADFTTAVRFAGVAGGSSTAAGFLLTAISLAGVSAGSSDAFGTFAPPQIPGEVIIGDVRRNRLGITDGHLPRLVVTEAELAEVTISDG